MVQRALPGLGLTGFWDLGYDGWKTENDDNLLKSSVLIQSVVLSRVTALPGSPTNGDIYIVPSGGHANEFAVRDNGAWYYIVPQTGWLAYVADEDAYIRFSAGAWDLLTSTGSGLGDVVGPGSAVNARLASFSGTTGKVIQDSGMAIDIDGTLAANSDGRFATQKAVKTYADAIAGAGVPIGYLDTDGTLAANSDTRVATQKAVKTYADALIAANDAMVFKGVIDCSANPNYPAADRGHQYRVSVAGKIGGGSGVNVEVGDMLLCLTDSTASGNQATVGTAWSIIQTNLDGAVINTRQVLTATGLTGGGTLAADRTIALDLNALTEDTVPLTSDFIVTYDVSASDHKKAKPQNFPGNTRNVYFVVDGGGSVITTGLKGDLQIPFACTILEVTMLADQSGSIVVDIWKDSYANYPPTIADTIVAAAKPTISSALKSLDATLTGWTVAVAAGDILRYNVDSITTLTRVAINLKVRV